MATHIGDSDSEDDHFNPAPADLSDDGGDDDGDVQPAHRTSSSKPLRKKAAPPDDEDEDDDDGIDRGDGDNEMTDAGAHDEEDGDGEEEEQDEDDEDEEDDVHAGHRRKRRRQTGANFFDIEAEVDDEDEAEDEEKDGEEIEDFIDNAHPDDIADSGFNVDDERRHRELDRRREVQASMDAEKVAEELRERYGKRAHASRGEYGNGAVVPKRLLLPSVDDPSIWGVRCKEGKEREIVFSIMRRIDERLGTKNELPIFSAFERAGPNSVMKGYIYVEAQRQTDVLLALDGVLYVYPRTKMVLVDIKDMPELLRVQKTPTLETGAWVRLRRPLKHEGDLAQVLGVTENGLEATVRFIPRLDYGARDDVTADGKRKRPGPPPPQRLFSESEAKRRNSRFLTGGPQTGFTYMGDHFENGFQIKELKIQALQVKDVNPTLDEVEKFALGEDDGTEKLDLQMLAASLKEGGLFQYQPGDVVEVWQGEQRGVVGRATHVQGDIATISVLEGDMAGQTLEVPTRSLRKRFKLGDHVKVLNGKYRDEVGMVVKIVDDRVTLLTDQTNAEISVFSKDLREADDIGGQGSLGQYALLDLVQLDPGTVGCIVKVDRETMMVLDQHGSTRQVKPSQIANKLPKRKTAVAADRSGSEIRLDDVVREYGGQQRQGKIIHIHRSFIFLHTNTTTENSGVFVTRAGNVNTIAAKGGRTVTPGGGESGPDLSIMNPAMKRNPAGGANSMQPPPKVYGFDKSIGQTAKVKTGPYKGLLGVVKGATDTHARVELHSKNKILTIPKANLTYIDRVTGHAIDINHRGGRGGFTSSSAASSGAGAGPWSGGRTPMATAQSSGGRTPAWGASKTPARTPAWGGGGTTSGSRTPAWGDGSRTVNPYAEGGRTSYGGATSYGGGSRTPAWQSGAKTPAWGTSGGGGDAWGSKTPAYGAGTTSHNTNSTSNGLSAPTPGDTSGWGVTPGASHAYDAPTPGAGLGGGGLGAPTPGAYSAPTPAAVNAPTPGGWQGGWGADTAPTPAAAAPTPGASGPYGAPTPAPYGAAETPGGPKYVDDD